MSPEDRQIWEEDAETEYAEAHAQARPATHSPAGAGKVSQDVGGVERARYALRDQSKDPHPTPCSDCGQEHAQGQHVVMFGGGSVLWEGCSACWVKRTDPARLALADEERAALVAEVERLRGPFRCCKHCPEDLIHDVEPNAHDLPCTICEDTLRVRAEAAEAKLAKVEALADEWERMAEGMRPGSVEWSYRGKAAQLRAVLADAPTEQTKGGE